MARDDTLCVLCGWETVDIFSSKADQVLQSARSSDEFASRLKRMSPVKRTRSLNTLLRDAMVSPDRKEFLSSLTGPVVQDILERIQGLLDASKRCEYCNGQGAKVTFLRRILLGLSRKTHLLPTSLFVEGVLCKDKHAIAGGGYADIYRARYQGRDVALKRFRTFTTASTTDRAKNVGFSLPVTEEGAHVSQEEVFQRETLMWRSLVHPNIQPFIGVDRITFCPCPCMVSPWQANGNIMVCLHYIEQKLGFSVLLDEWIRQILHGLLYLHDNDIVHGDLRGANVLIDGHFSVRLSDFGLAALSGATSITQGSATPGAVRFCAPELIEGGNHPSFASDAYAFACLCLEVHSGLPPFPELHTEAAVIRQLMDRVPPKRPVNSLASSKFWDIIEQCWNSEPSSRPSLPSLLSSLPLENPVITGKELRNYPHPSLKSPRALVFSPLWPYRNVTSGTRKSPQTMSVDPCLIRLIRFRPEAGESDKAHTSALCRRLNDLGFPQQLVSDVRDRWIHSIRQERRREIPLEPLVIGAIEEFQPFSERPLKHVPPLAFPLTPPPTPPEQSVFPSSCIVESPVEQEIPTPPDSPSEESDPPPYETSDTQTARKLHSDSLDLIASHQYEAASAVLSKAVEICRYHITIPLEAEEATILLATSLQTLGHVFFELERYTESTECTKEAIDLRRSIRSPFTNYHTDYECLASSFINLFTIFEKLGDYPEATGYLREAIGFYRVLAREDPEKYSSHLANSLHDLGVMLSEQGQYQEAIESAEESIQLHRTLERIDPDKLKTTLPSSLHILATHYQKAGKHEDAVVRLQQALDSFRVLAGEQPCVFNSQLVACLGSIRESYWQLGKVYYAEKVKHEIARIRVVTGN